ncbi:Histone-lysine N-methyltransferase setd1b [Blomia tropicalis]|nr:Histone-lysine N-methyltransferase setd1b [Blomia tropicalis]
MNGHIDPFANSIEKSISLENDGINRRVKNVNSSNNTSDLASNLTENVHERESKGTVNLRGHNENAAANFNDHKTTSTNSSTIITNHSHSHHHNDKGRENGRIIVNKNFKLISDPNLKKGAQKIIRYDGIISPKDPPLIVKDPRSRLALWNTLREPIDLIIPRFKIDKHYVGIPPAIEVSITNLNDNINKSFLSDMLKKFDNYEELDIFYHPKTGVHLGLAKVIFMTPAGARSCVEKLNDTSVMGNIIRVFFDPFAKEINHIFETIINPPPIAASTTADPTSIFIDPNNIDQLSTAIPQITTNTDYGYVTDSSRLSTDLNTPSAASFETQSFYQSNLYTDKQQWSESTPEDSNKSPIRESLDIRIKNLLREQKVGLGTGFLSEMDFQDLESTFNRFNGSLSCSNNRKNVQKGIDESEAILGTPPSPFMSASDFIKWSSITKRIDQGYDVERAIEEEENRANNEDDDRMSIETSSSNGDRNPNDSTTEMSQYLHKHIQDLVGMGVGWNPTLRSFLPDEKNLSLLNGSFMPHFIYESFVPRNTFFSKLSAHSTLGMPADIFKEDSLSDNDVKSNNNELIIKELTNDALQKCIRDLKEILTKDIYKKIIENFSYKLYDQWWDESEKKSKSKTSENSFYSSYKIDSEKKVWADLPLFTPQLEQSIPNRQNSSIIPNYQIGFSRGIKAAMPKMRKFTKKSPKRNFDDKLSDISDDEEMVRVNRRSVSSKSTKKSSRSTSSIHRKSPIEAKVDTSIIKHKEDDSSTSTADEMYINSDDEMVFASKYSSNISESINRNMTNFDEPYDEIIGNVRPKIKSFLEYEAGQALMELAGFGKASNLTPQIELINDHQISLSDTIASEHSYCIPIPKEQPSLPSTAITATVPVKEKKASQEKQKKERKKKEPKTKIDPNLVAVASEWRKAKRKNVSNQIDEFFPMFENDENKKPSEKVIKVEPPSITFPQRSTNEEKKILYEFLHNGLDAEDISFLKRSYETMLNDETHLSWINDVHWVDHPPTLVPQSRKRRRQDNSTRVHKTGCARTEGYYKLESTEKIKYSHDVLPINSTDVDDGKSLQVTTQKMSREARTHQRRLIASVEPSYADLVKFNQLKLRKKLLKFSKSRIHDWGLFAMERIPADDFVIEYVGQRVRPIVADTREKNYSRLVSEIDSDVIVDATQCGNVARFINHSCNPNCSAKVIQFEGKKKIVIYSKQEIGIGEEITYDYKFPLEDDKIVCLCQATGCRGFLN